MMRSYHDRTNDSVHTQTEFSISRRITSHRCWWCITFAFSGNHFQCNIHINSVFSFTLNDPQAAKYKTIFRKCFEEKNGSETKDRAQTHIHSARQIQHTQITIFTEIPMCLWANLNNVAHSNTPHTHTTNVDETLCATFKKCDQFIHCRGIIRFFNSQFYLWILSLKCTHPLAEIFRTLMQPYHMHAWILVAFLFKYNGWKWSKVEVDVTLHQIVSIGDHLPLSAEASTTDSDDRVYCSGDLMPTKCQQLNVACCFCHKMSFSNWGWLNVHLWFEPSPKYLPIQPDST